jgi:hypothetical protein
MRTLRALSYIEAAERSPVDGGDDGSRGFPLSAFCCIPTSAILLMSISRIRLSLVKITTTIIDVNTMAE